MITILNFKEKMIKKAKKGGKIWENFGQDEIRELKNKYDYSPYITTPTGFEIDELEKWAMTFDLSQLK